MDALCAPTHRPEASPSILLGYRGGSVRTRPLFAVFSSSITGQPGGTRMQTDTAKTPEHFDNRLLAALPEHERK
jgi:hypothetical protein